MVLVRTAAPLREQAVLVLRARIISGDLIPGERLTEKQLCAYLDVSRTVVREALRQLESERLVDIVPNIGPIVRVLSPEEATNLYEIREALEPTAARLAALRASDDEILALEQVLLRIRECLGSSTDDVVQMKNSFYRELITAAHNPAIGEMLANVQARISQLRRLTLSSSGRTLEMYAELEEIVAAIRAKDPDLAQLKAELHVRKAAALAQKSLQSFVDAPVQGGA
ncbi:MAG: GntR family transcriptional regulator [Microterricola sp.]